jgi:hypothetical protein
VQWATDPVWGRLSVQAILRLLSDDAAFLRRQLAASEIELVILNGRRVLDEFQRALGSRLEEVAVWDDGRISAALYTGTVLTGLRVIGWSMNLQSSWGITTEMRKRLAERVAGLAGEV